MTKHEKAVNYVKDNHIYSTIDGYQGAINIAALKAFVAGYDEAIKDSIDNKKFSVKINNQYDGKVAVNISYDNKLIYSESINK